jgi:hypothetical protein
MRGVRTLGLKKHFPSSNDKSMDSELLLYIAQSSISDPDSFWGRPSAFGLPLGVVVFALYIVRLIQQSNQGNNVEREVPEIEEPPIPRKISIEEPPFLKREMQVGKRVLVRKGKMKNAYGTVVAKHLPQGRGGQWSVTIADKKGRQIKLPISDFLP